MQNHALTLPDRRALLERCQLEVDRARDEQARAVDRIRRDSAREVERERRAILESLLPVLDDLDRAVGAAESTSDPAVGRGVELVRDRFLSTLAEHGVQPFGERGERFDPALHDAIARTAAEGTVHGHIAEVAARGYRVGDEVLRPAAVTVGWHEVERPRHELARPHQDLERPRHELERPREVERPRHELERPRHGHERPRRIRIRRF